MRLEAKKLLEDIRQASEHIVEFTRDKGLSDYTNDSLLQSGVERRLHKQVRILLGKDDS